MRAILIASCAAFIALGCQKSEPPAPLAVSAAPAAASAPVAAADSAVPTVDSAVALAAATPAAVAAVVKSVPAEADYEVQAQSTITPANAAQVLAAIDKQVGN